MTNRLKNTARRLFAGRPRAQENYRLVRDYLRSLGGVRVRVNKTRVSFGRQRKFASIWRPRLWSKKKEAESLTISFDLDRRLPDNEVAAVEVRPGRWAHRIVIARASDFNSKVRSWLLQAYRRGSTEHHRRGLSDRKQTDNSK